MTNGDKQASIPTMVLPKKEITLENIDHDVLAHLETLGFFFPCIIDNILSILIPLSPPSFPINTGFEREACIDSVINKKYDVRASTYDLLVRKREKDRKRREEVAQKKKEMMARRQQHQQQQQQQQLQQPQVRGHRRGASCTPAMVAGMVAGGGGERGERGGESGGGSVVRVTHENDKRVPRKLGRAKEEERKEKEERKEESKEEGKRQEKREMEDTSPVVFEKPKEPEKKGHFTPGHRRYYSYQF